MGYKVCTSTISKLNDRTSQVQRKYHHDAPVNDAVIHPNQGELISCDQAGSVKIWDLGENICTHELVPDEDVAIRTVTIASDGGTLVAGNDQVGLMASTTLTSRECAMYGRFIPARTQKQQHYNPSRAFPLIQASTSRGVFSPQIQSEPLRYFHMSANLRHLATCSADSTVRIWSTVNYEYTPEKTLTGHQRWVWDAAFSADSAYLVTGKFK
jgi:G protein beta subunit-like protein